MLRALFGGQRRRGRRLDRMRGGWRDDMGNWRRTRRRYLWVEVGRLPMGHDRRLWRRDDRIDVWRLMTKCARSDRLDARRSDGRVHVRRLVMGDDRHDRCMLSLGGSLMRRR
jgi:hypothetical protein